MQSIAILPFYGLIPHFDGLTVGLRTHPTPESLNSQRNFCDVKRIRLVSKRKTYSSRTGLRRVQKKAGYANSKLAVGLSAGFWAIYQAWSRMAVELKITLHTKAPLQGQVLDWRCNTVAIEQLGLTKP